MSILKINKKESNFTTISNDLLHDSRLSWKAKGILIYLLSKPQGWVVRENDMYNQSVDGYDSIRNGIRELKATGYAQVISTLDKGTGRFVDRELVISDTPEFAEGYRLKANLNRRYDAHEVKTSVNPIIKGIKRLTP